MKINHEALSVAVIVSLPLLFKNTQSHGHSYDYNEDDPTPVCTSVYEDPDGDGFGWVPHLGTPHTCVVTDETEPKPDFAHVGNTTTPINAIRPYWDPNVDIANREIECIQYQWNESENQYNVEHTFTLTHFQLANFSPYMGEYGMNSTTRTGGAWWSAHGSYYSDSYPISYDETLNMQANRWAEEIDINGQQGMRFYMRQWLSDEIDHQQGAVINGNVIQECRDTSGLPFKPTGRWDKTPTPSTLTIADIAELNPGPPAEEKPTIINPETGDTVNLQSFSWDIESDLLYKRMSCGQFDWTGQPGEIGQGIWDIFDWTTSYLLLPPTIDSDGLVRIRWNNRGPMSTYNWSVENGKLTGDTIAPIPSNGWVEKSDNGQLLRFWDQSGFNYFQCTSVHDMTPTGPVRGQQSESTDGSSSDNTNDVDTSTNSDTSSEQADDTNTSMNTENGGGAIWWPLLVGLLSFRRRALF